MKTTIEIADPLFDEARRFAAREGTTLRALVEQGLRKVLGEAPQLATFRLRDASFGGQGLQDQARTQSWDSLREWANERRPA